MTFDPLLGESLDQRTDTDAACMEQTAPESADNEPMHRVESLLLGSGSKWVSMLQALTILDHERCCEPPRQSGVSIRRRLVKSGQSAEKRLDASALRSVLDHQRQFGGHVEHILVHLGLAEEEEIVHELTTHYGFPYLPLSQYEFDSSVVRTIPLEVARHYCVIPVDKINNVLTVAMANPLNTEAQKDIERLTGCTVLVMVARASEIREKIDENHHLFSGLSEEGPN